MDSLNQSEAKMAKSDSAAAAAEPVEMVADGPASEARARFAKGGFPAEKPPYLTRQQYSMLREHVSHGRSYSEVGRLFGGMDEGRVRGVIGQALDRIDAHR